MNTKTYITKKINNAWSITPTGHKRKDANGNFKYEFILTFKDKGDGTETGTVFYAYCPNNIFDYRELAVQRFCDSRNINGAGYLEYNVMLESVDVYSQIMNGRMMFVFDTLQNKSAGSYIYYDVIRRCFTC